MTEEDPSGSTVRCANCDTKFQIPNKKTFTTRTAEAIAADKSLSQERSFNGSCSQKKSNRPDFIFDKKQDLVGASFFLIGALGIILFINILAFDRDGNKFISACMAILLCALLIYVSHKIIPLMGQVLKNSRTTISSTALLDLFCVEIYVSIIAIWIFCIEQIDHWIPFVLLAAISILLYLLTRVAQCPERIAMHIDENNPPENDYTSLMVFIPKALMYIFPFVLLVSSILWIIFTVYSFSMGEYHRENMIDAVITSIGSIACCPLVLYILYLGIYTTSNIPANIAKIVRHIDEDQE